MTQPACDLRAYQPGDETAICALFATVFGGILTPAQWSWKYQDCAETPPLSQVAVDGQGNLLAHAGALRLRGQQRGQSLPFYQITDVMVHPTARGYLGKRNLFTQLLQKLLGSLAAAQPLALGYGFPGERPFLLGARAGVYARITTARASIWNIGLPGRYWLRPVALDWTHPAVERVWQQRASDHTLSLIRNRRYLIWRYANHPFRHYHLLGFSLLGRIGGWAVLDLQERQCRVLELLVPPRWLAAALRVIDGWAQTQGATTGMIWLPDNTALPLPVNTETTPIVVTHMRGGLAFETAAVRQQLVYSMGDADIY